MRNASPEPSGAKGKPLATTLNGLSNKDLQKTRDEVATVLGLLDHELGTRNGGEPPAPPHLIYLVHGISGRFLQVNDAMCETLQYAHAELEGFNAGRLLRPGEDVRKSEPEITEAVMKVRRGEWECAEFDQWLQRRDGGRGWYRSIVTWDPMSEGWLIDAEPIAANKRRRGVRGVLPGAVLLLVGFVGYGLLDEATDGKLDFVIKVCKHAVASALGLLSG